MQCASQDIIDHEAQKLMKLKVLEQNLASMLQKIDKEINQTDVEWMHLKSLNKNSTTETRAELLQQKSKSAGQRKIKQEHHMDDQAINKTQLNLSLGSSGSHISFKQGEEDEDEENSDCELCE